jgi:hypothetical protein
MDITEKNGQPSMEEILASIRRIIAEEPSDTSPGADGRSKMISLHADASMDDHSDFELPAIFRASPPPAAEKSMPLLGRLTDAIRGTTAATTEAKPGRGGDDHAGDPAENGAGTGRGEPSAQQYPALSSLRPARHDPHASDTRHAEGPFSDPAKQAGAADPAPAAPPTTLSSPSWKFGRSSPPPPGVEDEIKRVMAPFKDTRFKEMAPNTPHAEPQPPAEPLRPPAPVHEPWPHEPATAPRRVDFSAIIPAHMDLPGVPGIDPYRRPEAASAAETPPAPHYWVDRPGSPPEAPHYAAEALAPMPANPLMPSYPDSALSRHGAMIAPEEHYPSFRPAAQPPLHEQTPTGTIEDTTADLLRPMLRQWLADNMPRMVEKALHIEVAETVKTGRKLPGQ